jgi:glycosyltransferase involved in cell wall biosynthesis
MAKGRAWPRISIVTASYNQGKYIEETLRSVLLQGYPNLEFMVLDGGSTDDSLAIIEKYEPWLSYVLVDPTTDYSTRLRMGLQRSTGSIQAWLNTDDTYEPGTLGRVARFFAANPDTAMANGDVYFTDQESRRQFRFFALAMNRMITGSLGWHRCPQPGCFWSKWAYEQTGGVDTSLRFSMDRDLYLRLSEVGRCRRLPGTPVATFRQHPEARSSTSAELFARENHYLIRKYGNPMLQARYGRLRLMWFAWSIQRRVRERLNTAYGLEY